MKAKRTISEVLIALLAFYFVYDGGYKMIHLTNYGIWVHYAPLLTPIAEILKYMVPSMEIFIGILLLTSYKRQALCASIICTFLFAIWIMCAALFTHRIFSPFHSAWRSQNWMGKLFMSVGISWLAFVTRVLVGDTIKNDKRPSNLLRNIPGEASDSGSGKPLSAS